VPTANRYRAGESYLRGHAVRAREYQVRIGNPGRTIGKEMVNYQDRLAYRATNLVIFTKSDMAGAQWEGWHGLYPRRTKSGLDIALALFLYCIWILVLRLFYIARPVEIV
jgi:hypothetical protein